MIVKELISPESIAVIGASNDISKPGGRILKNILDGSFKGKLYCVNPKESSVQGISCSKSVSDIGNVDLAIIAIAAKFIPDTMKVLAEEKGTKGFIVLSAGFSEMGAEGRLLEEQITDIANEAGGAMIGPNCIGVLTPHYNGVFAGPIPKLDPKGCDFVTGSGATSVFVLETAIKMGITFASLFSVGNSAQIGVEEVLEYWDEVFDPATSSKAKIIYMEQVPKPSKFLKHSQSLIKKGCRIAAIKAGRTEAGSRAVSSHTGALAGSDAAVDALFRKAGIVRCFGRDELSNVAGVFLYPELTGNNLAVITHAGGPGVMLTDRLNDGGINVPHLEGEPAEQLLSKLFHGSSVANPIDYLATGTPEQLGLILDAVENDFSNIDGSVVISGTPGLVEVYEYYRVLDEKMKSAKKPIFPVLPSILLAEKERDYFISLGRVAFIDETSLGAALCKVKSTSKPYFDDAYYKIDSKKIRRIIDSLSDGYLNPKDVQRLLDAADIPRVPEFIAKSLTEAVEAFEDIGGQVVMKVIGPVHKSDIGGVRLFINNKEEIVQTFNIMMEIEGVEAILIQKMLPEGLELFVGAKYEPNYGHIIYCGLGGILIEIMKDTASSLTPIV
ncbi:MAG: hypothetical protein QG635_970, partial [Bacteroidota bacterium]|nr:hypothetical protein [Bacteroidota bacterium]